MHMNDLTELYHGTQQGEGQIPKDYGKFLDFGRQHAGSAHAAVAEMDVCKVAQRGWFG